MIDENWSEWSFVQFLEALEKWTINNPIPESQRHKVMAISNNKREKSRAFYAKRDDGNQTTTRGCLFCESPDHIAIDCDKVVSLEQRKKIFLDKRLCFNCTGSRQSQRLQKQIHMPKLSRKASYVTMRRIARDDS